MKNKNYGLESEHKTVLEWVETKHRENRYLWRCKLCGNVSGPSGLFQILQDRVGRCCFQQEAKKVREMRNLTLVGTKPVPGKILTEYLGETEGEYPHPLFKYECVNCSRAFGPNQLQMITKYDCTPCCSGRGSWSVLGYGVISTKRIKNIYTAAKRRSLECTVTAEYLDSLYNSQRGVCAYTGIEFESIDKASLDRIDSNKGYTPGNVQWVLREINTMKMDLSDDRFRELCSMVSSRKGRQ